MQLHVVESVNPPKGDDLIPLGRLSRKICFASLQRKTGTQIEPDYWLLRLYNNRWDSLGHTSFRPDSPLIMDALGAHEQDLFALWKDDMPAFENMCRANGIELFRVTD